MVRLEIKIELESFEAIKDEAARQLKNIVAAKSIKDVYVNIAWGGLYGGGRVSATLTCPLRERIASLRAEADALEAEL